MLKFLRGMFRTSMHGADGLAGTAEHVSKATEGAPFTSYVIPPDSIAIRQLRLQVQLDADSTLYHVMQLTGPHGNLYAYYLWRRQVKARRVILNKVDRGEPVTEDDLLAVAGADRKISGTEASFLLQAHRDIEREQREWHRESRRVRPGAAITGVTDGVSVDPAARVDPSAPPHVVAAEWVARAEAVAHEQPPLPSLAAWFQSRPSSLLATMRSNPVLAHESARESPEYEALAVAWARTMIGEGQIAQNDLPAALQAWLDEDMAARAPALAAQISSMPWTIDRAYRVDNLMAANQRAASYCPQPHGGGDRREQPSVGWFTAGRLRRLSCPGTEALDYPLLVRRTTPPQIGSPSGSNGAGNSDRGRPEDASRDPSSELTSQSHPEVEHPYIYVDGTKLHGAVVAVHDGRVVLRDPAGQELEITGQLHRDGGPAVVAPDGTSLWYQHGRKSRDDGPAVEAADPMDDEYWHAGQRKSLRLPPGLYSDRAFRAMFMTPWRRLGYPDSGDQAAHLLLITLPPAERREALDRLWASRDPTDREWAAANEAMLLQHRPDGHPTCHELAPAQPITPPPKRSDDPFIR